MILLKLSVCAAQFSYCFVRFEHGYCWRTEVIACMYLQAIQRIRIICLNLNKCFLNMKIPTMRKPGGEKKLILDDLQKNYLFLCVVFCSRHTYLFRTQK